MRHDPTDPQWPDRDRFVLSCGHASILLYSMLYLTGYGLTLDDLKHFRAVGQPDAGPPRDPPAPPASRSPPARSARGSPTGWAWAWPSGGCGPASGPSWSTTTPSCICSDGDLEEGISHEAASLAGHLGLGRLVYVYDNNHITIDGPTELAYSDDVPERFAAYGWHIEDIGEVANDTDALEAAMRRAMAVEDKPSMIVLRSHIGWPSPDKMDTADGPRLTARARRRSEDQGDPRAPARRDVLGARRRCSSSTGGSTARGREAPQELADALRRLDGRPGRMGSRARRAGDSPGGRPKLPTFEAGKQMATRRAINACLNATADLIPGLMPGVGRPDREHRGGASTGAVAQSAEHPGGSQVHYGIREHAMGGVMNGLALHGGRPARRGHLLRLQRLHAPGGASGRAVRGPRHLLLDPRLGRAR